MPMGSHEASSLGSRNLRAVSLTSFLTDLSSEMVFNLLPLYLTGTLGLKANVIGVIEGVAKATASLLKVASGWWSDRLGARKRLAVAGYGLSALAKPLFLLASGWLGIAVARWVERIGKGVRTAPRDALLADSTGRKRRGRAFGLHRAADTAGAVLGLAVAMAVVWWLQGDAGALDGDTFRTIVLVSLVPAFAAVVVLARMARDVPRTEPPAEEGTSPAASRGALRELGRPFWIYLCIAGLFDLGNSADAFIVLLAHERGLGVLGVLGMLMVMNAVYALTSGPGGSWSDRAGRRTVLVVGWTLYALVYLGFALVSTARSMWALAILYGLYLGLTHGTVKAMVGDLVPRARRGLAFGLFAAVLGVLDVPASVIAGVLWHGAFGWTGFGPSAAFLFGAGMAALAAATLALWRAPIGAR